jgi:hypothetical protein
MYKGNPFKITADFSMETLKTRMAWSEVIQAHCRGVNIVILNWQRLLWEGD